MVNWTNDNEHGGILISTDLSLLNVAEAYDYLHKHMYWAANLQFETFQKAVQHSAVVIAAYDTEAEGRLAGFARVVSDRATFAYLLDVFVVTEYRGQGISKRMMRTLMDHPDLQGLRRFLLVTKDAHGLYAQFGFQPLKDEGKWMHIYNPGD
ncbi:GCN5-related N-acetyltransferase [Paenibacillus curdlanolyticus YK9]|uniref:GCN5-related N-acetyltransferase n=1 Tax=Paenibacillus curdlanolyticus YK9 TaxID=717606 RepID=E0ICV1_9BACL|nr:GNAT family N-acetyltransferase [Paenibacillus curdlanolyticus]EFM09666.1 GCN5-related N-acetyltransferase [Paenibacillus curdlanolyticus YK9]